MALDKHGIIARASFIVRLTGDLTGDMMGAWITDGGYGARSPDSAGRSPRSARSQTYSRKRYSWRSLLSLARHSACSSGCSGSSGRSVTTADDGSRMPASGLDAATRYLGQPVRRADASRPPYVTNFCDSRSE